LQAFFWAKIKAFGVAFTVGELKAFWSSNFEKIVGSKNFY
jgi:hypothetical protein